MSLTDALQWLAIVGLVAWVAGVRGWTRNRIEDARHRPPPHY